jgi:hypothetical protein
MVLAVEKVRERLIRATDALDAVGLPHCVVGGNAVAAWAASVDASAVRNTPNVDILLRREDLDAAGHALESAGFSRRNDVFLDGPNGRDRDAVRFVMAGEKFKAHHVTEAPDVADSLQLDLFRVVSLERLVEMKLTASRAIDATHLRDMLNVGLIDASWVQRYGPELGSRLQYVIDTPEG